MRAELKNVFTLRWKRTKEELKQCSCTSSSKRGAEIYVLEKYRKKEEFLLGIIVHACVVIEIGLLM